MAGNHSRHAARSPRPLRRAALIVVAPLVLLTLAGMVWLWPGSLPEREEGPGVDEFEGVVTQIVREECPETDDATGEVNGCGRATVRLDDAGADDGEEEIETILPNGPGRRRSTRATPSFSSARRLRTASPTRSSTTSA